MAVNKIGEFGPIYSQFKGKPKLAIKHLKKVRNGEALKVFYRDEIGFVDLVWGENDPKTNKGFGLKHIIEKHSKEIARLGFEVEDFLIFSMMFGRIKKSKEVTKVLIEGDSYRIVLLTEWKGKPKQFVLTAFDLIKK